MSFTEKEIKKKQFWESRLSEINNFNFLSLNKVKTDIPPDNLKSVYWQVDSDLPRRVKALTENSSFLKYVLFSAAIQICLLEYSDRNKIIFGTPLLKDSNTNTKTSLIPIINEVSKDTSIKQVMNFTRKELLNVYENVSFSLDSIIYNLGLESSTYNLVISDEDLHYDITNNEDYDLYIRLKNDFSSSIGEIRYNDKIFNCDQISQLIARSNEVLEKIFSEPTSKVHNLSLNTPLHIKNLPKDKKNRLIEEYLNKHPLVQEALVNIKDERHVAFIKGVPNKIRSNHIIKSYLLKAFSDSEIPSEFIWVNDNEESIIDQQDFLDEKFLYKENQEKKITRPRNEIEKEIALIWSEVLGVKDISIEDNFFELGGDSLLSIQVFYKMKQKNLNLTPKDIIASPTIGELSSKVSNESKYISNTIINSKNIIPMSPSKYWFFDKDYINPNHFNNSWIYEVNMDLDIHKFEEVLNILTNHHDSLNIKYFKEDMNWRQSISQTTKNIDFIVYDLSQLNKQEKKMKIDKLNRDHQLKLSITSGPLLKVILFKMGENERDQLLIISHRLLMDSMSINILSEDFQTAYKQLELGQDIELPIPTTTYQEWSNKLYDFAHSKEIINESPFWTQKKFSKEYRFPVDFPEGSNTEDTSETVFGYLDEETTMNLMHSVTRKLNVSIRDISFTAFLLTIHQWTGEKSIVVESGGHGREHFDKNLDLTRTLGWFGTHYPVYLMLDSGENIISVLKNVKKQLSSIPSNGFGYGLLKYANKDSNLRHELSQHPLPKIGFDYQGNFTSREKNMGNIFTRVNEEILDQRDPENFRIQEFDISNWISEDKYTIRWTFSNKRYKRSTIEQLVQTYITILNNFVREVENY
ncbi:hypothetical protein FZC78_22540 [Rossellomorea vietnamensis]|uniref:Carrier domain-containing protein n=1 Tax=Rossellomorea vietnamensis TaxID=218284 RepID=A0A5D4NGB4_9BACI|nr:condensation domain-containing protein [Rossellomorea vietnamensis]TYS13037.1 hypothetical protein FZC78_22540 [Rossellomorea vietnamensis]